VLAARRSGAWLWSRRALRLQENSGEHRVAARRARAGACAQRKTDEDAIDAW
jgi:hypothetical protein